MSTLLALQKLEFYIIILQYKLMEDDIVNLQLLVLLAKKSLFESLKIFS